MTLRTESDRREVAREVDSPGVDSGGVDSGGVDCVGVDGRAIDRDAIAALVPHSGGMVLLDRVVAWDDSFITCRTRSHLDQSNPLRRAGRLAAVCGVEYALQAAALHGGLAAGGATQPAGFLAALRDVALHADWLDDKAIGDLYVTARLERHEQGGSIYALELRTAGGGLLLSGRAIIALPPARRP
jgi:predicted hotdog family 3-hydroxylacyl-ACP dehydratase